MLQRFLQVFWRIEVVLKEKLHGPLTSFTALSHIGNMARKGRMQKEIMEKRCDRETGIVGAKD